eukprot:CAMPEP_0179454544 /NCGR_PEP_ID=MMETSP0799-20121207/38394_1 /TAXON_ID=46947 /ORGANISM="Geminigera cryophila, Strain CCMP2564" /LENGTH=90 /DNA_ID=CAMNT_0021252501 /DNA_START=367 /DNA_END=639 /DNA_ORIENTATION=+
MAKTNNRGLIAVNVSMGAGGMGAVDVAWTKNQAKTCTWMLKTQDKEPENVYHARNMEIVVARCVTETVAPEARCVPLKKDDKVSLSRIIP